MVARGRMTDFFTTTVAKTARVLHPTRIRLPYPPIAPWWMSEHICQLVHILTLLIPSQYTARSGVHDFCASSSPQTCQANVHPPRQGDPDPNPPRKRASRASHHLHHLQFISRVQWLHPARLFPSKCIPRTLWQSRTERRRLYPPKQQQLDHLFSIACLMAPTSRTGLSIAAAWVLFAQTQSHVDLTLPLGVAYMELAHVPR